MRSLLPSSPSSVDHVSDVLLLGAEVGLLEALKRAKSARTFPHYRFPLLTVPSLVAGATHPPANCFSSTRTKIGHSCIIPHGGGSV